MTTLPDLMGSDGIGGGEMTPANFDALCMEHLAAEMLVRVIGDAIEKAKRHAPYLDTGLLEDALSDFRGGMPAVAAQIDAYEEANP